MWAFVALAAFLGALAGLISLIVPLRFLGIKSRLRGLGILAVSFIAFVVASVQLAPETSTATSSVQSPGVPVQQVVAAPVFILPQDQNQFVKIVEGARNEYRTADTDFRKGATRPARAKSLCQSKGNRDVNGWIGEITALTTNSEGKGVIAVRISNYVTLKTWNNSISDLADNTLVEPGSSVFSQLGQLRSGDKVKFSGSLGSSSTDCFNEGSVTLRGSMSDPEFLLRFRSIGKL